MPNLAAASRCRRGCRGFPLQVVENFQVLAAGNDDALVAERPVIVRAKGATGSTAELRPGDNGCSHPRRALHGIAHSSRRARCCWSRSTGLSACRDASGASPLSSRVRADSPGLATAVRRSFLAARLVPPSQRLSTLPSRLTIRIIGCGLSGAYVTPRSMTATTGLRWLLREGIAHLLQRRAIRKRSGQESCC